MNISKLQTINFGMPKISSQIKKMLSKNLSQKDIEILKQVEAVYPNAQMDIESNFGDPIDTKYTKIDDFLSRIGIYYPIYRIVIKGKSNETLPLDESSSTNGKICPLSEYDLTKFKKGHSSSVTSTGFVRHRQIKPSDLKKAVKLYQKDINAINQIRKGSEIN